MFVFWIMSVMALVAGGTTVNHCHKENYNTKECVGYVKSNLVADYTTNVND